MCACKKLVHLLNEMNVQRQLVLKFTNKNMDTFTNSDVLNFKCQVSPFSAVISLKKSLVKERNGFVRLPPRVTASKESDHTALAALEKRNMKLEEDLENSRVNYDCVVDKLEEANRRNRTLEELKNKQRKIEKRLLQVWYKKYPV